MLPRVRTWPEEVKDASPALGGFIAFKAGMLHLITVDDREKTPNFGKPLFVPATVLAVPAMRVFGIRAYSEADGERYVLKDVYDVNFELFSKAKKKTRPEDQLKKLQALSKDIKEVDLLVAVSPKEVGLSQKEHLIYEIPVIGNNISKNIEFAIQQLGKTIQIHKELQPGQLVDIAAVSKGKGFEGPVTRFGVKRKQHKSRKSVRAVGVLSPWHPHDVMYTVPRAGQKGFHQRIEYNHKVMSVADEKSSPVTPPGGFPHFGVIKGDYVIIKGSVPGPAKRPVVVRQPVRAKQRQVKQPQIIFVSTRKTGA